jgi:mRNA interferase YafQ
LTGAERGPLQPSRTRKFKQDLERCKKPGYDMDFARVVMGRLSHREPLEPHHRDHPLKGEWEGHRECHLKPDWLLIYRIHGTQITFERTGSHSHLFDE